MKDVRLTVVMTVFNGQQLAAAAIESILSQTCSDFEFLIIDDGSTDATPQLLREYAARDSRIRLLHNSTNRGTATSLNTAWRSARGELVARMDADDESLVDRLSDQIRFLDSHPAVDVVGGAAVIVDAAGRTTGVIHRAEDHETLARQIYWQTPFFNSSVAMRKNVLAAMGGYDERLRRAEDADFWLRAYRRFRFANLPQPLVRYRMRRRPLLADLYWGPFVLARGGAREGRWGIGIASALRNLTANLLTISGLRRSSLARHMSASDAGSLIK